MALGDLFRAYNIGLVNKFSPDKFRPGVVLGPPASGKSFIISSYYSGNACESIIGFPNLEPIGACGGYVAHEGSSESARFGGIVDGVVGFFKAVFPWVRALMETKPIGKVLDELRRGGFTDVEVEAIKMHFTDVDRVPRQLVEHLTKLRSAYGPVMAYHIPWNVDEGYELGSEVREAVAMIKRHFERGIRWLGVKYMPPGLVAEVVEKIGKEGRDKAEEYVREQANAYYRVVRLLVGEEDVEFEGFLAMGVTNFINQFTANAITQAIGTALSGFASLTISAVTLAMALSLIYQLTKKPEVSAVDELIGLREYWPKLHESLRRLIASKVALQLGTTPEKAEEALNQLTGIEVDRLKQLINDVQNRLRELEEEVKKLRDDVRKFELKDIFEIYWVDDFMRGLVYPGVKVINGSLVIHTLSESPEGYEDVYRSVVVTGAFEKAVSELAERLKRGDLTVVVGPRGIGKSTLTAKVLWDLLSSRKLNAVVRVRELNGEMREMLLKSFLNMCRGERYGVACGSPVILYDPSPPLTYGLPTETKKAVIDGIGETLKHLSTIAEQAPVIAVLPSDVVNALSDDARRVIEGKEYTPDLKDEEFISDLITEYSGCAINEDKLKGIAKSILKFDEGHALIARLVGEELRRSNCEAKSVEDLLGKARGDAMAFMVNYVNRRLGIITENGEWDPGRIRAFSRLLPVRQGLSFAVEPGDYVMPRRLLARWFGWEGLAYSEDLIAWLAQRQHSLIEGALGYITLFAIYPNREGARERLRNELKNLEQALTPWVDHGEKLPEDMVGKLLNPLEYSYEVIANYFNNYFLNRECKDNERSERYVDKLMQEFKPECWRRLALMAGAAVSMYPFSPVMPRHPFSSLVETVGDFLKEGEDVFPGLAEAIKPCGVDGLFLEGGELTPFSVALLMFGYGMYKAYTNVWGNIAGELKGLRETLLRRYLPVEAVYALGLATLIADARHAGQSIDAETAKTALWLASFVIRHVFDPSAVDIVVKLLRPLRDHYWSGWASLLNHAANVEVTPSVLEELKEIYGHVSNLEDWAKAMLARAYARVEDVEKTCSLLNEIKDDVLKIITGAYVYHFLAGTGKSCPNANPCKELEDINQRLKDLEEQVLNPREFLDSHPGLEEYLRWYSFRKPEEVLNEAIKEAHGSALSGLMSCALGAVELNKAVDYFSGVEKILREIGYWVAYLIVGSFAISFTIKSTMVSSSDVRLEKVVNELKDLWSKALQEMELKPNKLYLIAAAVVLGDYLVALALMGRHGDAEKLLEEYDWLLNEYMNRQANVATRLTLKYLGVNVKALSSEEVLGAVEEDLIPEFRLAMKEALGGHVPIINALSTCEEFDEVGQRISCITAYLAMQGNKEAEERIKQSIIDDLRRVNAPPELLDELLKLLDRANARQLIEVYAPKTPMAQFILLLRALASGDRDSALLHAEVGRVKFSGFVGELFGGLADALKRSNEDEVKLAIAKLYF